MENKCTECDVSLSELRQDHMRQEIVQVQVGIWSEFEDRFVETRADERKLLCRYCAERVVVW